jgi:hypothetical protein
MTVKLEDSENELRIKKNKISRSKIHTNCFASAAMALDSLHGRGSLLDVPTVMDELIKSAKQVTGGDITEIEQMLMTQAKTLDYIFYDALNQLTHLDMINQIEVFSNIAFRAQTQCRKTLSVLAELKHPRRTTFIQQQNNAITQQVNNAVKSKPEPFENSKKVANELISEVTHEKMDIRGTIGTGTINTPSEALGVLNRHKNI